MALPKLLSDHLALPVIGSPLFIASNPDLVIAQCKAGIVGAFPALNARPASALAEWLTRIKTELADYQKANPAAKVLQRLLGLEAKMNQYAQGERFIAEVERLGGGPNALDPVWRGASWLPTLAEIRDPEEWVDRVRLSDELVV